MPTEEGIDLTGLDLDRETMRHLLAVDREAWLADLADQEAFFARFDRLPPAIHGQMEALRRRLGG